MRQRFILFLWQFGMSLNFCVWWSMFLSFNDIWRCSLSRISPKLPILLLWNILLNKNVTSTFIVQLMWDFKSFLSITGCRNKVLNKTATKYVAGDQAISDCVGGDLMIWRTVTMSPRNEHGEVKWICFEHCVDGRLSCCYRAVALQIAYRSNGWASCTSTDMHNLVLSQILFPDRPAVSKKR